MLDNAYNQKKNDPFIIDTVGWGYYLIGDFVNAEKFIRKVKNNYKILTGKSASIYVCKAINGATVFSKNELITY